jgi:DNA primase
LVDAMDVADRLGLGKDSERYKWECPACGSSDALHAYPGSGRGFYCWSCSEGFDAIGLVDAALRVGFKASVRWLAQEFAFDDLLDGRADHQEVSSRLKEMKKRKRERERKRRAEFEARRSAGRDIWEAIWHELALDGFATFYLASRSIPIEAARHVGIRSVETRDDWGRLTSPYSEEELERAGILGRSDGETFPVPWRFPCLVIPYWRPESGIDIMRFRPIDSGGAGPKYLSPLQHKPEHPFLGHAALEAADDYDTLYICEGELNALSVVCSGGCAISSCGNGVWRPEWSRAARWFSRIVVLCDGDESGRDFSMRVREATVEALGEGWASSKMRRVLLEDGMDANDYLQSGKLEEVLRAA